MVTTLNPSDQTITQYNIQTGGANNLLNNVAPSATSGIAVISQGASSQPIFGTVVVAGGGTGAVTLTGVLTGNGTSAVTASTVTQHGVIVGGASNAVTSTAVGSTGQVLQANSSADPTYSTATYPSTATGTGTILRADGTNWSATTSTYPNTNAINTLLYASAANVMSALATANSGVLATNATGVPSIDTTNFAVLSTGLQLKGNNTNTAPPAGFIGEQIRATIAVGSATALTNATPLGITSVSLTAGIWDISCVAQFTTSGTNTATGAGISTSNSSFTGAQGDNFVLDGPAVSSVSYKSLGIAAWRVAITTTTTYYLTCQCNFSTGVAYAFGRISGTRVG